MTSSSGSGRGSDAEASTPSGMDPANTQHMDAVGPTTPIQSERQPDDAGRRDVSPPRTVSQSRPPQPPARPSAQPAAQPMAEQPTQVRPVADSTRVNQPVANPAPTPTPATAEPTAAGPTDVGAAPMAPPPRPRAPRRTARVRKARLRLVRVDPWSVMKTAFLLSIAFGVMLVVAVVVLWSVLDATGVFASVGGLLTDVTATDTNPGLSISEFVELPRVLGFSMIVAVVDVVLLTALATLGAFLYNLAASLLGGLELTLAEDE